MVDDLSGRWSRRGLLGGAAAAAIGLATQYDQATAQPRPPSERGPQAPFGPVDVFRPPAGTAGWGVKYARVVRPRPRTLVATCENLFDPARYAFPVFRSTDSGANWRRIGAVEDGRTGGKPRWQPALYALPERFAGLPRGTLLCAGNTIPDDYSSTRIDLFVSPNGGVDWSFLSTVAAGGPPIPANGQTPVWEPSLLLHRGRLICYYTDQRDPRHGQKLVHQTTTDLVRWGPVVNDQADPVYDKRPGMPAVAQIAGGRWILVWEDGNNSDVSFGLAYKIAAHPESFATARPQLLRTADGLVPIGSPTVTWCPVGGRSGTIVVSAGENEQLFVNRAGGTAGTWATLRSVVPRGYSRQVQAWDRRSIMTIGGGPGNDPPPGLNLVQFGLDALTG